MWYAFFDCTFVFPSFRLFCCKNGCLYSFSESSDKWTISFVDFAPNWNANWLNGCHYANCCFCCCWIIVSLVAHSARKPHQNAAHFFSSVWKQINVFKLALDCLFCRLYENDEKTNYGHSRSELKPKLDNCNCL